ncbi:nucleotidyltransferase family protein [Rothia sp. ZJ1223]|uniref:nucleotidyltransferase family protein n=1 Tax=Rothia sp. ZJ1223 TaxID=2811098 RepID=UPI00351CB285
MTSESKVLMDKVLEHKTELQAVFDHYDAHDLRVFGSVARGDAGSESDIDFMV